MDALEATYDVKICLGTKLKEGLPELIGPKSPLKLKKELEGVLYVLDSDSQNSALRGNFGYKEASGTSLSKKVHFDAQLALGFIAESELHYPGCVLTKGKLEAFKEVMNYLTDLGITHYMTVIDCLGKEIIYEGNSSCPSLGKLENKRFKKTLAGLLE